ncbi:MAG: beta-ketoacyl synthase N-terminal-like domain-containing protein [Bacteroidota bacterium]
MAVYIKGIGNISPQHTAFGATWLNPPNAARENKLSCIEPDYHAWIDPRHTRRMSRIIKMGVAAAYMALKESGVERPDAIITGTGYGCLEDTGTFLNKMIENNERALNPTPFIQSTHNTIGSQIALLLQCQGYNQTYTHGTFSFENVLLDALVQLSEFPERNILAGGIDEITPVSHQIQTRFGKFRASVDNSLNLFADGAQGTLHGEGSAFFVLTGSSSQQNIARVESVRTYYKPSDAGLMNGIESLLSEASIKPGDIDLVLSGTSGDTRIDAQLDRILTSVFALNAIGRFKHLCGEYPVASSFALALGAKILQTQQVPAIVVSIDRPLKHLLIFNQYFGTHYSLILLQAC